jgi:hypothetical protein
MSIWFWLFLLLPPLLVFSAKPEDTTAWRNNRLLLAVAAAYGGLALGAYLQTHHQQEILAAFLEQHPECVETYCTNQPVGYDMFADFIIVSAWIPAFCVTGAYEFMWRLYYFHRVRAMNYAFGDKLISNIILVLAFLAAYPAYFIMSTIWFNVPL